MNEQEARLDLVGRLTTAENTLKDMMDFSTAPEDRIRFWRKSQAIGAVRDHAYGTTLAELDAWLKGYRVWVQAQETEADGADDVYRWEAHLSGLSVAADYIRAAISMVEVN